MGLCLFMVYLHTNQPPSSTTDYLWMINKCLRKNCNGLWFRGYLLLRFHCLQLMVLNLPHFPSISLAKSQTPYSVLKIGPNQSFYYLFRCFGGLCHRLEPYFRSKPAAQFFSWCDSGHQLQLRGQDHWRLLCWPGGWLSALSCLCASLRIWGKITIIIYHI